MYRAIFTIILISNLLACPLRCASCNAGAVEIDEWVPVVCSCCHHGNESSENSDDAPVDDCSCPNCMCEGATLQDGVQLWDVGSHFAYMGPAVELVQSDVGVSIQRIAAREIDDGRGDFFGRNAHVAFQSWLI